MDILIFIGEYAVFALLLSVIAIGLAVRSMPIGRINADQEPVDFLEPSEPMKHPIEILEPDAMPACGVEGIDMRAFNKKFLGE